MTQHANKAPPADAPLIDQFIYRMKDASADNVLNLIRQAERAIDERKELVRTWLKVTLKLVGPSRQLPPGFERTVGSLAGLIFSPEKNYFSDALRNPHTKPRKHDYWKACDAIKSDCATRISFLLDNIQHADEPVEPKKDE